MKKGSIKKMIINVIFLLFKFCEKVSQMIRNTYYQLMQKGYLNYKRVDYSSIRLSGNTKWSIHNTASFKIGNGAIINSGVDNGIGNECYSKVVVGPHATLIIGDEFGMSNTVIQCHYSITIGDRVRIGNGSLLIDSDFHSLDWRKRTYFESHEDEPVKCSPIVIGDNVFIGTKVIVTKGAKIGDHCVIAAGSVVVGNVPNDEIWGGNPAKFIRKV